MNRVLQLLLGTEAKLRAQASREGRLLEAIAMEALEGRMKSAPLTAQLSPSVASANKCHGFCSNSRARASVNRQVCFPNGDKKYAPLNSRRDYFC